ncbi:RCC1/BLIP-II [Mycena filopes]|nr:RCC1/BLIP-II [Mycena filopes]
MPKAQKPPTTRTRKTEPTAGTKSRAKTTSKRARPASPPPLNPIPGPSRATKKQVLLVHGAFDAGQLGLGDDQEKEVMRPRVHPAVLQQVTDGSLGSVGVESVAAGGMHSLFIDSNGKIWSFGLNDSLALGRATKPPEGKPENVPELVDGLDGFRATAVAASDNLSVAISETGELRAWGTFNSDGLLGFKGHKDKQLTPTTLAAFSAPKKPILLSRVACGEDHALALTTDGRVYAWGNGASFQLGRRILERRKINGLTPEALPKLRGIVGVFAGAHTSFAVDDAGRVFGWGLNQMRQTGVESEETVVKAPTEIDALAPDEHGGARVVGVAGGEHHTCFLFDDGSVWGCGRTGADRLGLAADHPSVRAHNAEVAEAEKRADQEGWAVDDPRRGALPKRDDFLVYPPLRIAFPPPPTPSAPEPPLAPYAQGVFSATRITQISAGERYTLAVSDEGYLYSWGEGNASQLGLGNVSNARTPTRIANTALKSHEVVGASAGGQHVLLVGAKRDESL